MTTNNTTTYFGKISLDDLKEFEDYMHSQFAKAELEYNIPRARFFRRDALIISLNVENEAFLPLSKGYAHLNNRIELLSYERGFPEILSRITRCMEPRRLFLYADGVWVNSSSDPGPTFRMISWALPRESWLLKKAPFGI